MKNKKNFIIELIILISITISVFIIYKVYRDINDIKPKESDSYQVPNYAQTKNVLIRKDLNDALTIFNIPEQEAIFPERSRYDFYITATDNQIKAVTEIIWLEYDVENKDNLTNFCNSYNDIESAYRLKCELKDNRMEIKNNYYLDKIYTDSIKTKNYEFRFPFRNEDKLDEYLEELEKENVEFQYIDNIS